ncbi:hypothetical protein ES676_05215 [Bizionia saleffrena]|uniref:Uncharacterized protein n=2 Tax=Bizionia saleffrena TaxID=291189 RepID=A0A8H2LNF3_9FLAO|nr:hypothetical protein ES676_05215 [Bizionia saleffrena]
MIKNRHKLTKKTSKFQHTDRKNLIMGSLVAIAISISPYFFYLYESVPNQPIWDTFLFTYKSEFYNSANVAFWTITGKSIPLYFLTIWFFTCRHWWYHALLIPMTMYIYQLTNVLNDDLHYIDSFELKYFIPLMALIIPSIYLIRAKIFNRINSVNKSTQELEDEMRIRPLTFIQKIKQYF